MEKPKALDILKNNEILQKNVEPNYLKKAIVELEDILIPKTTTWHLVNQDESHYSCNNCKFDFHLANDSSLLENSINFCPSCGYKIKEIIER